MSWRADSNSISENGVASTRRWNSANIDGDCNTRQNVVRSPFKSLITSLTPSGSFASKTDSPPANGST